MQTIAGIVDHPFCTERAHAAHPDVEMRVAVFYKTKRWYHVVLAIKVRVADLERVIADNIYHGISERRLFVCVAVGCIKALYGKSLALLYIGIKFCERLHVAQ